MSNNDIITLFNKSYLISFHLKCIPFKVNYIMSLHLNTLYKAAYNVC